MRVVVLMSTYNGERYVVEQLCSILEQLPPNGRILIRDDGSTDQTVVRIEALNEHQIKIIRGENIGFARSFLSLLLATPQDAEMVMFSDQDDVWLPGKIERAWQHLQLLAGQPGLYASAQMLVDESLRPLQATPPWPRGPSFPSALTENIVTGCTAAFNRSALALLQSVGVPNGVRLHDWWLYLVVSAFGTVVIDSQPTLLYRQHGANLIGHGAGWLGRNRQIMRFLLRNDWVGILLGHIAALHQYYGNQLSTAQSTLLQRYFYFSNGSAKPRWRLIFSLRQWRQSAQQEIMFRVLLALHRLHLWPLPGRRI